MAFLPRCGSVQQRKVPDQDVAQGSYIALPLTLLLLLAAYNHEKVRLEPLMDEPALLGWCLSPPPPSLCGPGDPPLAAGGQSYPGREDHGPSQRRRRRSGGRQTPGQETESQAYMNGSWSSRLRSGPKHDTQGSSLGEQLSRFWLTRDL